MPCAEIYFAKILTPKVQANLTLLDSISADYCTVALVGKVLEQTVMGLKTDVP